MTGQLSARRDSYHLLSHSVPGLVGNIVLCAPNPGLVQLHPINMFAAPARRAAASAVRLATPRRSATTVADVALVGLENRWSRLPECEQAAIAEKLLEKQKGDWRKMTSDEKRAGGFFAPRPRRLRVLSFAQLMAQ